MALKKTTMLFTGLLFMGVLLVGLISCQGLALNGNGNRGSGNVTQVGKDGSTSVDLSQLQAALEQFPIGKLTNTEEAGILYVREEEKLAHDVYTALYEKWNLPIFQNIASSEETHTNAMKLLIERYGLTDPALSEVGKFTNKDLQELYDQLVAQGEKSLIDALKVGAAIEELDLLDIQKYVDATDKGDLKLVYESLMKGSRNHLRAFVSTLKNYGVTYTPQYLTQEEYDQIINSAMEKGNTSGGSC